MRMWSRRKATPLSRQSGSKQTQRRDCERRQSEHRRRLAYIRLANLSLYVAYRQLPVNGSESASASRRRSRSPPITLPPGPPRLALSHCQVELNFISLVDRRQRAQDVLGLCDICGENTNNTGGATAAYIIAYGYRQVRTRDTVRVAAWHWHWQWHWQASELRRTHRTLLV